jgi:hypothetical protein
MASVDLKNHFDGYLTINSAGRYCMGALDQLGRYIGWGWGVGGGYLLPPGCTNLWQPIKATLGWF